MKFKYFKKDHENEPYQSRPLDCVEFIEDNQHMEFGEDETQNLKFDSTIHNMSHLIAISFASGRYDQYQ